MSARASTNLVRASSASPSSNLGGLPVVAYVRKGGLVEDTEKCVCSCNGLMATCGLGQVRRRAPARAVMTSGDAIRVVRELLAGRSSYSANDVTTYLDVASVR